MIMEDLFSLKEVDQLYFLLPRLFVLLLPFFLEVYPLLLNHFHYKLLVLLFFMQILGSSPLF